jgi:HEAT repeat protein
MLSLEYLLAELTSGDDIRAESASGQFISYGKAAVEALIDLYNNEDADIRWWAIRALSAFNLPKAKEYLTRGLRDESLEVRQCATLALRENPDPAAIPELVSLLGHKNKMLSRLAGDALIAIGKEATQAIIYLIEIGPQTGKIEATRVLASIEDPESISSLFKLLDEDSTLLRYWAEEGLNKMGIGMVFFKPE